MHIPIFAGYDPREAVGFHAFTQSVIDRASVPVSVTALHLPALEKIYTGGARDGTNAFIYSRFLVPYLMRYNGFAIFADGADMLCMADIAELWAMRDPFLAVQVVQHDYRTKNPIKYIGTPMEAQNGDYPRKNWSSLMLINCKHYAWRDITPETVETMPGRYLHRLEFITDRFVGALPMEWNWLADEYGPCVSPKLLHWTAGIPGFKHYENAPHAEEWRRAHAMANHAANHVLSG